MKPEQRISARKKDVQKGRLMKDITAKAAFGVVAAANLLAFVNSFMIAERAASTTVSPMQPLNVALAPFAPGFTFMDWRDGLIEELGPTPVSYIGDKSRQYLPPAVDVTLDAAFSAVSIPGSCAGHAAGAVTGCFMAPPLPPAPAPAPAGPT